MDYYNQLLIITFVVQADVFELLCTPGILSVLHRPTPTIFSDMTSTCAVGPAGAGRNLNQPERGLGPAGYTKESGTRFVRHSYQHCAVGARCSNESTSSCPLLWKPRIFQISNFLPLCVKQTQC